MAANTNHKVFENLNDWKELVESRVGVIRMERLVEKRLSRMCSDRGHQHLLRSE